jgi:membrane protease YdiL (CAAX protease family)
MRTVVLGVSLYFGAVIAAAIFWGRLQLSFERLEAATAGWLSPQLILPLATMILILAVVGPQRLLRTELGWSASAVVPACITLLAAWLVMHAGLLSIASTQEHVAPWIPSLHGPMYLQALSAQLIGNSLLEESVFRGLLIGEFSKLLDRTSARISTVIACSTSVVLFSLAHLPILIAEGNASIGYDIFGILRFGLVLTIAYLLTRNVLACVGFHAIWNADRFVFDATSMQIEVVWSAAVIAVAAGYFCLRRRRRSAARPIDD